MTAQQALFEATSGTVPSSRRKTKTRATPSRMRDAPAEDPLSVAVAQLALTGDALERARIAVRVRYLAEQLVSFSIRDASRAGRTWRDIGAALDIPFQTLHRRYGDRY